jgi:hypothetical protein
MMPLTARKSGKGCLAGVLLGLLGMIAGSLPARADLYSAEQDYKAGHYGPAFREFLALAQLGQPVAQRGVAIMYRLGRGVDWSDIHAYAWASLAARNGDSKGKALADALRPRLAPGSQRIAGWATAAYRPKLLEENLLPDVHGSGPFPPCKMVKPYYATYPEEALRRRIAGTVFVDFTVMPDGSARFPRIVYAVPPGIFESTVRYSVLRSRFGQFPADSQPLDCFFPYRFKLTGEVDWSDLRDYVRMQKNHATPDDPQAELVYGLLLDGLPQLEEPDQAGLPWLVKAAQGGIPLAQYEVGFSLLRGEGCERDEFKALRWLELAAAAGESHAEVALAIHALNGKPGVVNVAGAKTWLDRAANTDNEDAKLFLTAILAAAPQPALRDPKRALQLLHAARDESDDPAMFEIRAAAEAAGGDFPHAVKSEQKAIHMARKLAWDLGPLEQRLLRYESHHPWWGNLLNFSP